VNLNDLETSDYEGHVIVSCNCSRCVAMRCLAWTVNTDRVYGAYVTLPLQKLKSSTFKTLSFTVIVCL